MSLGLSHSLSRHKLKFSAHKIDQMIISAVSLIDDIDKELNVYAMRVKEVQVSPFRVSAVQKLTRSSGWVGISQNSPRS